MVDGAHGDQAEVGRGRAGIGTAAEHRQVGGGVPALAVDQHQRVIGVQAAQGRRQGEVGGVAAEPLGVERRQVLGQGLDQVGLGDLLQGGGAQHLDRRSAVRRLHPGLPGAGDDHLFHDGRTGSRGRGFRGGGGLRGDGGHAGH